MQKSGSLVHPLSESRKNLWTNWVLLCNEAEAYAYGTKSATPEQIAVKAHERKRQSLAV